VPAQERHFGKGRILSNRGTPFFFGMKTTKQEGIKMMTEEEIKSAKANFNQQISTLV